jgi:dTDP-4-dehydrorhamnose reductase
MDSGKLIRAMGRQPFCPWPADERLVPTSPDWHFQRQPGEAGSFRRIEETLYRSGEPAAG